MLTPLPGHAIVKLDSIHPSVIGLINIPQTVMRRPASIGTVLSYTPYPAHPYMMWTSRGKKTINNPSVYNKDLKGIEGHRFLVDTFREIPHPSLRLALVRIEHLIAEIPPELDVKARVVGSPDRCTHCKSTGEMNILLDSSGYCPVCGKDAYGNKKAGSEHPDKYGLPVDKSISQEELDHLVPV